MSDSNPSVTSKFDRNHGKPRTPAKVTHPGGTAPVSGTAQSGHNAGGHRYPHESGKKVGHD